MSAEILQLIKRSLRLLQNMLQPYLLCNVPENKVLLGVPKYISVGPLFDILYQGRLPAADLKSGAADRAVGLQFRR